MKILILIAALITTQAKADGLFMGADWSTRERSRSEDTIGVAAGKNMKPSVQVYAQPYRNSNDGICDTLQPRSWDDEGTMAYRNSQAVHTLYKPNRVCEPVYYPGFAFIGGQPNMALATHWNGQPDFVPSSFSYMDWLDPRYNPALRYGG